MKQKQLDRLKALKAKEQSDLSAAEVSELEVLTDLEAAEAAAEAQKAAAAAAKQEADEIKRLAQEAEDKKGADDATELVQKKTAMEAVRASLTDDQKAALMGAVKNMSAVQVAALRAPATEADVAYCMEVFEEAKRRAPEEFKTPDTFEGLFGEKKDDGTEDVKSLFGEKKENDRDRQHYNPGRRTNKGAAKSERFKRVESRVK